MNETLSLWCLQIAEVMSRWVVNCVCEDGEMKTAVSSGREIMLGNRWESFLLDVES